MLQLVKQLWLCLLSLLCTLQEWDGSVPAPTILKPEPLWTGKQVGWQGLLHPVLFVLPIGPAVHCRSRSRAWLLLGGAALSPAGPLTLLVRLLLLSYTQIFSCFLPPVNLVRTSSWAKENDDKSFSFDDSAILIKRGKLIHGEGCAVAV
jgi:hypothetical protein